MYWLVVLTSTPQRHRGPSVFYTVLHCARCAFVHSAVVQHFERTRTLRTLFASMDYCDYRQISEKQSENTKTSKTIRECVIRNKEGLSLRSSAFGAVSRGGRLSFFQKSTCVCAHCIFRLKLTNGDTGEIAAAQRLDPEEPQFHVRLEGMSSLLEEARL